MAPQNATSLLPFCLMQSWGTFQPRFPLFLRTAGSSGHHQAGIVLFLGRCGSSIFSSSKIFLYFAQAQSSCSRPRHEPPQLRAQNRTTANGWHCKEVASMAMSRHLGISTAQGTAAPSLACVHFTSTSLSPSCEATR